MGLLERLDRIEESLVNSELRRRQEDVRQAAREAAAERAKTPAKPIDKRPTVTLRDIREGRVRPEDILARKVKIQDPS